MVVITRKEFEENPREALKRFASSTLQSPEGCDKCCLECTVDCWMHYSCDCRFDPCERLRGEELEKWKKKHLGKEKGGKKI